MTSKGSDGEEGLAGRGVGGQRKASERAQDLDLYRLKHTRRRGVGVLVRTTSQCEDPAGYGREYSERIDQAFVVAQLPLREGAACLERFEVLLDRPSRAVAIHNAEKRVGRVDGFGREEEPLDRLVPFGRVGLPDAHDVKRQRGGESLVLARGTFEGDARPADCELRQPRSAGGMHGLLFWRAGAVGALREPGFAMHDTLNLCDGMANFSRVAPRRVDEQTVVSQADDEAMLAFHETQKERVVVSLAVHH